MLDRIGAESGHATTIVRYAAESQYSAHTHQGGEEFLVLDGVFQDEHGDFHAGTYVRNPPGSRHAPGSAPGCTIFVKLWQFDPDDRRHVDIDMNGVDGEMFRDAREVVSVERWAADSEHGIDAGGGAELLVLDGSIEEAGDRLCRHDWLRLPPGYAATVRAGAGGARVWIKRGHLADVAAAPH